MKIVVQIMGGLGNQMFQYACGKAVANRIGAQLYLNLSWFKNGNRAFMLDAFPNIHYSLYKASLIEKFLRRTGIYNMINYLQELDYSYWQGIENVQSSSHLSGYWQNEKYFSNISSIIKQDFLFPEFPCLESENTANAIISSSHSVSIHIRRGDYVEDSEINQVHGICTLEYYKKALQLIVDKYNGDLNLYLFSDDPLWVRNNFDTQGYPSVIVDIPKHKDAPYHDIHLMSLCRHHIVANSSFSWWGAWLSGGYGMVIAPKRWFAEETLKQFNPATAKWITIE